MAGNVRRKIPVRPRPQRDLTPERHWLRDLDSYQVIGLIIISSVMLALIGFSFGRADVVFYVAGAGFLAFCFVNPKDRGGNHHSGDSGANFDAGGCGDGGD